MDVDGERTAGDRERNGVIVGCSFERVATDSTDRWILGHRTARQKHRNPEQADGEEPAGPSVHGH